MNNVRKYKINLHKFFYLVLKTKQMNIILTDKKSDKNTSREYFWSGDLKTQN